VPPEAQDKDAGDRLKYNPDFEGPTALDKRERHDLLFLWIYLALLAVTVLIVVQSAVNGDYKALIYGENYTPSYTPAALRCGENHGGTNDLSGLAYLHWPEPTNSATSICVSECPGSGSQVCSSNANHGGACWSSSWDTKAVLYRCEITSCSASWSSTQCEAAKKAVFDSYPSMLRRLFADIVDGWWCMALGILTACLTSIAWLATLQLQPSQALIGMKVWCGISVASSLCFCLLILLNTGTISVSSTYDTSSFLDETSLGEHGSLVTLGFGLAVLVLLIWELMVLCYLHRHRAQVGFLLRETAVPLCAIPRLRWVPVLPASLCLILVATFLFVGVSFFSMEELSIGGGDVLWGFVLAFVVWMLLWTLEIALASSNLTTSGAVGGWYWSKPGDLKVVTKEDLPLALQRSYSHSIGSATRHALNATCLRWMAYLVAWLRQSNHRVDGSDGPSCPSSFKACCCCLLPCADGCIKFIDDRSLVQVALHGHDWIAASRTSFGLMYRNRRLIGFAQELNHRVLFVAKVLVMSAGGTVTFGLLHHIDNIYNPTGPTIIVCALSCAIATSLVDLYGTTADSIMTCFAEDRERHDGSSMRQYYMTSGLKQLLLDELDGKARLSEDSNRCSRVDPDPDRVITIGSASDSDVEEEEKSPLKEEDVGAKKQREEFEMYARDS